MTVPSNTIDVAMSRVSPLQAGMAELDSLETVRDCVRWSTSCLLDAGCVFGHGTENAFEEALWLVYWSLHLPLDRIDEMLDARVLRTERRAIGELLTRRCQQRLPLAYLIGEAWLQGRRFECDARALVPRSPIAALLESEDLMPWILDRADVERVLDLCTGGGSLAVIAAQTFERAMVVASDLSSAALDLAATNVGIYKLDDRISFAQGDLYQALQGQTFDLIICNPPYVNADSMSALPPEYLAEPNGALGGGSDGMDLARQIVAEAPEYLNDHGLLLLEIGHEADHFEAAFPMLEINWLPVPAGDRMIALLTYDAICSWLLTAGR